MNIIHHSGLVLLFAGLTAAAMVKDDSKGTVARRYVEKIKELVK